MKEALEHYEANKEQLDLIYKLKSPIQPSNDLLQPLIEPFQKVFPGENINGCAECVIGMLGWYQIQLKKSKEPVKTKK